MRAQKRSVTIKMNRCPLPLFGVLPSPQFGDARLRLLPPHLCDLRVVPEAGVVQRSVAVLVDGVDVRLVVQQLKTTNTCQCHQNRCKLLSVIMTTKLQRIFLQKGSGVLANSPFGEYSYQLCDVRVLRANRGGKRIEINWREPGSFCVKIYT